MKFPLCVFISYYQTQLIEANGKCVLTESMKKIENNLDALAWNGLQMRL
jgi:hypothetical protein